MTQALDGDQNPIDRSRVKLLYVSTAKYGGDWHSTLHTHGCTEVFYVVGGSGKFNIAGRLVPVKTDQMDVPTFTYRPDSESGMEISGSNFYGKSIINGMLRSFRLPLLINENYGI